jgi:hypothetical protein
MLNRHDPAVLGKERIKTQVAPKTLPLSDEQWQILKGRARELNPKVKIVKGGAKSSAMDDKYVDAFIIGYADKMLIDYVRYLDGKNPFFQFLKRKAPNQHQIVIKYDVKGEQYDFTNSMLNWAPNDLIQPNEPLPIEVSRGCIFRCKFCSYPLNGKKKLDFIKNPQLIKQEMIRNYELFGTTQYAFMDDTYNDSVQKIEMLGNAFQTLPFKLKFIAYLRHDLIWAHKEMADILLESGLVGTQFGIETLNHDAGKAVGKGLHPEQVLELLHWLKNEKWHDNVLTHSNFILGLPKDTPETIAQWSEQLFDPNFPLHSWSAKTFMLKYRKDENLEKQAKNKSLLISDIALNYKDYGYSFPNPVGLEGHMSWVNERYGTSYVSMLALERSFNARKVDKRITCWGLMQHQTLGYHFDDMWSKPFNVPIIERYERRIQLVNKYYEQLMRL